MKISRKYETFSSESDDENYDESSSIDEETEKKEKFLSSINYTPVTNSGSFKVNNKWLFLTYSNVHTKYTKYEEIEYENPQKRILENIQTRSN